MQRNVQARVGQVGISLVEIMVALALSTAVITMISQVFLSVKRSHVTQANIATMQANARHALQVLSETVRMAGYMGENQEYWNISETADLSQLLPGTITSECFTTDSGSGSYRWLFPAIYADGGSGKDTFYGPMLLGQDGGSSNFDGCISADDKFQANTDVISVHYVGPEPVYDAHLTASTLYARVNLTGGRLFRCDASGSCVPSDNVAGEINYPIRATTFYVSSCASPGPDGTCDTSDDIPGLRKVYLHSDGKVYDRAVAEGVVNMQVRYGLDTNDDGLPDKYVDAGTMPFKSKSNWKTWATVRSVRIWLLMRSDMREAGFNAAKSSFTLANQTVNTVAGYRYQAYSVTISLRNS